MRRRGLWLALSLILAATVGCDQFKLLDQFSSHGSLELVTQKKSIQRGESMELYPSGGVPPYAFAVLAADLYYEGSSLGSIRGQPTLRATP